MPKRTFEGVEFIRTPKNTLLLGIERKGAPDMDALAALLEGIIRQYHLPLPVNILGPGHPEMEDAVRWAVLFPYPGAKWWARHREMWVRSEEVFADYA